MQLNKVAARGLGTALAAGLLSIGLVGVASADVAAKAVVTGVDVTAGFTGTTTIAVTNLGTPNITAVRILPPLGSAGQVVATLNPGAQGTGGSGWSAVRTSGDTGWKFSAAPAASSSLPSTPLTPAPTKGLPQGGVATFTLPVTYITPDVDTTARWRVQTSTNDGASYTDTAAGAGSALVQTIRVLTLTPPTIDFVRPGLVTAGQDNRQLTYTLTYLGTGSMDVATSASNTAGDSSETQTATLSGAARSLTYRATPSFPTSSPTQRALTATATGVISGVGSAVAVPASTGLYTVQEPAVITVSACSATVSGNHLFTPTATVATSGAADDNTVDSVSLAADGITLDYGTATSPSTATLRTARTAAKGTTDTGVLLTDVTSAEPAADQTSAITYAVNGIDANGATVRSSGQCGSLDIDVTAPVATGTLSTGIRQPTAVGQTRATADGPEVATDGTPITIAGTIAGGTASALTCDLVEYRYDGSQNAVSPADCTLSGSAFSGSGSVPHFNVTTTSLRLRMTTTDEVGNTTTTESAPLAVDSQPPGFDDLTSTTVDSKTITVVLDELTAGSFLPQEFTVTAGSTRYLVSSVTTDGAAGRTSDVPGFARTITLKLNSALGEDDMPLVSYKPLATGTTPAADGAGNLLATTSPTGPAASVTVLDGIAPAMPGLISVNGKAAQLGPNTYYVNGSRPVFRIGAVGQNHTAEVYLDSDLSDTLSTGDQQVCSALNDSSASTEVDCITSVNALFTDDADYPLLVVARDAAGNVSAPEGSRLTVDTQGPSIVSVQRTADGLLVTFNEIVVGRDYADDWFITSSSGAISGPLSVTSAGSGTQRRLTFADGDPVLAAAVQVNYAPAGPGDQRYQDLAGNTLSDGATRF